MAKAFYELTRRGPQKAWFMLFFRGSRDLVLRMATISLPTMYYVCYKCQAVPVTGRDML